MGCASEHYTRENRVIPLLRQQLKFRLLSAQWPIRLRQELNRVRREKIQRAREEKINFRKRLIKTKLRFYGWKKQQLRSKKEEILALSDKYGADPASVTPEDWNKLAKGSEWKLDFLLGKHYPREEWPAGVPYLNIIGLRQYEKAQKEQKKQKIYQTYARKHNMSQEESQKFQSAMEEYRARKRQAAEHQKQVVVRDAKIRELEHFLAQWEKLHVLLGRSRLHLKSVTLKEWEDATSGTDIADTNTEIAHRMEFARRLDTGEVDKTLSSTDMMLAFTEMRRAVFMDRRKA